MSQQCSGCQRLNPPEAAYCYYDGKPLANGAGKARVSSIDFRTWAFPHPFVFPTGEQCHNFVELAVACRRHPDATLKVLRQGFFETFFGSVGRVDLAQAAKAAARTADRDRALDDFLDKFPGSPLQPARLAVEPTEKDLGVVPVGADRAFTLTLSNEGQRLLTGKAAVEDCPWLLLGDKAEKVFQTFDKVVIPVQVVGNRLRAYTQAQKAEITIESNGGNFIVAVEVTIPVKPFEEGVLAGAASPRQLAEKAKAHPREAGLLLEQGAVARWYEVNGWPYPVQGPVASGVAAVQQFFEVLGLVKPPKVELDQAAIALHGKPGERLESRLTVTAQEKRAVVAHGVSDQPWLKAGTTEFHGKTATIPVLVDAVPSRPGETLTAHLKVHANGNQRFDVPVTLQIAGTRVGTDPRGTDPRGTDPRGTDPTGAATPTEIPAITAVEGLEIPEALSMSGNVPVIPAAASSEEPLDALADLTTPAPARPRAPARSGGTGGVARAVLRPRYLPVAIVALGLLTAIVRDAFFRESGVPLPAIASGGPASVTPSRPSPTAGKPPTTTPNPPPGPAGNQPMVGVEFTFTVQVQVQGTPPPGTTATINLPPGLELVGDKPTVPVVASGSLTWKLRALQPGAKRVKVQMSTGQLLLDQTLDIRPAGGG